MNINYNKEDLDNIVGSVREYVGTAPEIMESYDIPYEELEYDAENAVESYIDIYSNIKRVIMEYLSEQINDLIDDVKEQAVSEIAEELIEYTGVDYDMEESNSTNKDYLYEDYQ